MKSAKQWLQDEGYPSVMTMTGDNLEIILTRYAAEKDARIKMMEEVELLTKQQRDEWSALSIRKQAKIDVLLTGIITIHENLILGNYEEAYKITIGLIPSPPLNDSIKP